MGGEKALKLKCAVQTYAWGRRGSCSTVAKLAQNNPEFHLDEDTTYAEYWMGTHPKGPSMISDSELSLDEWIKKYPDVLGEDVLRKFDGRLPFLFKVLSVNKALSIQAHPNKHLAAKLRLEKPENYPDDNHKPEMAIALTEFEGLCGFRPFCEVAAYLDKIPELQSVVGLEESSSFLSACKENKTENVKRDCFKKCFTALMTRDSNIVKQSLSRLVDRLSSMQHDKHDSSAFLKELLLRLNSQFPGDVGCFCIYFMNYMVLMPGQAIFLGPNLPHAYLAGDCIECMACSDNTVRAGLTPKFRDVETLCEMLDYTPGSKEDNIFKSQLDPSCPYTEKYDPPVQDFAVRKIQVPCGNSSYTLKPLSGPSIIIIIEGDGHLKSNDVDTRITISPGVTLFSPAKHSLTINSNGGDLLLFQAYCDITLN